MARLTVVLNAKNSLTKSLKNSTSALKKMTSSMFNLKTAVLGLGAGFGAIQLGKELIDANSELEVMQFRLEAMLGSAEAGKQAFSFIKDFQKDLPLADIQTTTDAFVQLVSAGIDPTTGALEGLVTASAKFGLTSDDIKGVTRALRQTTAVTNAQKQELNQLAERIPKIQKLIADELNLSQNEFLNQMERRALQSSEVASATLRALQKTGEGVAERYSNTWQAGIARIRTAWFELLTAVGGAGLFDQLKSALNGLTTLLTDNRESIVAFANSISKIFFDLGRSFLEIFDGVDGENIFKSISKILAQTIGAMRIGFIKIKDIFMNILDIVRQIKTQSLVATERFSRLPVIGGTVDSPLKKIDEQIKDIKGDIIKIKGESFGIFASPEDDEKALERIGRLRQEIVRLSNLRKQIANDAESGGLLENIVGSKSESALTKIALKRVQDETAQQLININNLYSDADEKRRQRLEIGAREFSIKGEELKESLEKLIDPFEAQENLSGAEKFAMGWENAIMKTKETFKVAFDDMESLGKFMAKNVTDALGNGFNDFFNRLIDGDIKSFKDAILDFLKSIARAINQQLSAQLATGITSKLGGLFGGSGFSPSFKSVQTDAGGSFFNSAGFSPGTGQALTKASSPMKVEIMNQSGEPLRAKSAEVRQDPSGAIMSVVIDSLARNKGGSRDTLKTVLA